MKTNELQNGAYKNLLTQFERHLQVLNYAKTTVEGAINATKDYLSYLEENQIQLIQTATTEIRNYFTFLEKRTNKKTGSGLSNAYLLKYRYGLSLFYEFLQLTQNEKYSNPVFPMIKNVKAIPKVLTKEEIQKLFAVCDESLLGKRNKALLAIYYGCGLRRQEGVYLNVEDIDLEKGSLFIAKSKTHRQRNVPLNSTIQKIVEDYLFNVREKLISKEQAHPAFLVTEQGNRLSKDSVSYLLQKLLTQAKIKTKASPHTLRHSIATHLLQSGMKLESISLFLGHRSLDSTQLYTHLANTNHERI